MNDNKDIDMQTFQLDIAEETQPNKKENKPEVVKYKVKKSSDSELMLIAKGIALGVFLTFILLYLLSFIKK